MQPINNNNNRGKNNPWPRGNLPNDQMPPTLLEYSNVIGEPIPFYRLSKSFHEESACALAEKVFNQVENE